LPRHLEFVQALLDLTPRILPLEHLFLRMRRGAVISTDAESVEPGREGLVELYQRHGPDALRLAYLLTGDRALAEDLVQEAFARMVGRLAHLRDLASFGPYLRRTVVNLSRMHFRRIRVERAYLRSEEQTMYRGQAELDPDLREDLWRAVLALPARQRAAIVLRYYEDLSEQQVADILNCRPGTVKSLVSRGLSVLRGEISDA
jgi:RNA polymerase sigma-70 factor (sigma-E family)